MHRTVRFSVSEGYLMEVFEILYTKTHEWLGIVDNSSTPMSTVFAYVGISNFALKAMSDIVYLDLPAIGNPIVKGDPFGEIESVKAVSNLFAPVDGEVVEINQAALDNPDLLMSSNDIWLIKIKINKPDISHLMSLSEYEEQNVT